MISPPKSIRWLFCLLLTLAAAFPAPATYTKEQMKTHIDFALNTPSALEFVDAFMNTMYPYKPRKA